MGVMIVRRVSHHWRSHAVRHDVVRRLVVRACTLRLRLQLMLLRGVLKVLNVHGHVVVLHVVVLLLPEMCVTLLMLLIIARYLLILP